VLDHLVKRSMVVLEPGSPSRYRLLETLRQYAVEQLDASGEREGGRTPPRGVLPAARGGHRAGPAGATGSAGRCNGCATSTPTCAQRWPGCRPTRAASRTGCAWPARWRCSGTSDGTWRGATCWRGSSAHPARAHRHGHGRCRRCRSWSVRARAWSIRAALRADRAGEPQAVRVRGRCAPRRLVEGAARRRAARRVRPRAARQLLHEADEQFAREADEWGHAVVAFVRLQDSSAAATSRARGRWAGPPRRRSVGSTTPGGCRRCCTTWAGA
jgi:hypothetical protein